MDDDLRAELEELAALRRDGLITDAEHEQLRVQAVQSQLGDGRDSDLGEPVDVESGIGHRRWVAVVVGIAVVLVLAGVGVAIVSGDDDGTREGAGAGSTPDDARLVEFCERLLADDPAEMGFEREDSVNAEALNLLTREAAEEYITAIATFSGRMIQYRNGSDGELRDVTFAFQDAYERLYGALVDRINEGNVITTEDWAQYRRAYEDLYTVC